MSAGAIRVGISGWTYAPWRGVFYPKEVRREHELAYAASRLRAIEINADILPEIRELQPGANLVGQLMQLFLAHAVQ